MREPIQGDLIVHGGQGGTRVAVLGAGAWGTALSLVLARGGAEVRLWTWQSEHAEELARQRESSFLPGFTLPSAVSPTSDLEGAVEASDVVLVVVPSDAVRQTLAPLAGRIGERPVVVASKGIEQGSLMLMDEVVADVLGAGSRRATLSGPSFAAEVAREAPTNIVIAAQDEALARELQQLFAGPRFRVYTSDDPVGVEVGGALKNVVAIAAGACDGLGFGYNTRAALITRGLAELSRLAQAKGGDPRTLAGLAGMGDLVLTCTGELSRNRTVGLELGRGRSLPEVLSSLGHVAEGVKTAQSTYDLARSLGVELPICFEVYRVLYEGKSPEQAVEDVLTRPLKRELD
ncbi:MAG: NAD(P)-dependent glycerol-3-phosphate dehydrogenase [Polyangiaceae bacterium]|nr:NAD(P)-dependent glycerol-3-phosphate dehydrogenase [Polyangiaceae bacterium]MCW5791715.1 NAD(P)-dependent glycerol-3-phosphate dehydrogenase [Polyangiaceae bacterium]